MVEEVVWGIVSLVISTVSLFGWLFCSGHLITIALRRSPNEWWMIGALSFVFTSAVLAFFSPIIAFTSTVTTILGCMLVVAWVFFRPPFSRIAFPPTPLKMFILILFIFLTAYFATFVFTPDDSFDSLSYHLPFIREFASTGQVGYPAFATNWLEHIHYSYPRAIEMVFGLVHQTHQDLHNWFHFWLLLLSLGGILHLAKRFKINSPLSAVSFLLAAPPFFIFMKMFPVELGLFVGVLTLISLLPLDSKPFQFSRALAVVLFVIGLFFGLSKLNSIFYVGAICLVSGYFSRNQRHFSFIPIAGALVGTGWFVLQSFLHGANFFTELSIAQALTSGVSVPILDRVWRIAFSFFNYSGFPILIFGVGGSFYLAWRDKLFRPLALIIIVSLVSFVGAFAFNSLYIHTYGSFGIYAYAFIGLSSLILARLFQIGTEHPHFFIRATTFLVALAIFVSAFYYIFLFSAGAFNGYAFDSSRYYPELIETVPNDAQTTIFFMNNINPLFVGFENATIYDHTTFPRPEGDPCAFWNAQRVTHIVYWAQGVPPYQLDGGNPAFYTSALSELHRGECTTLLYDGNTIISPLIARINLPFPT